MIFPVCDKFLLVIQDDQGNVLNSRTVTKGHSDAEKLSALAELYRLRDGWESSKAVSGHLVIAAIVVS